jgi:hypothetical protein
MAMGTFSPAARIGAMTWGPAHDVWSAAIALSQINYGLGGHLGYKEVERAIAGEVTSTKDVYKAVDVASRQMLGTPGVVTRGLRAGAAVAPSAIATPTSKAAYVADWCEDLGFADFYNIAFRLFGVSAFSTHWLYFSLLLFSCIIFVLVYFMDEVAISVGSLAIAALFLCSSSTIFSESMPSFAANRYTSTLAAIPVLHVLVALLRQREFGRIEFAALCMQTLLLAFVISVRSSAQWGLLALVIAAAAIVATRLGWRAAVSKTWRLSSVPFAKRVAATIGVMIFICAALGYLRNAQLDKRYFWEDNLPHHLFWHSAFLGLAVHPQWEKYKPLSDLPNFGDGIGFNLFVHEMMAQGKQYVLPESGFPLARKYEPFIRDQYVKFAWAHPRYMVELMSYYKPMDLLRVLSTLINSIGWGSRVFALFSLVLAASLLVMPATSVGRREAAIGCAILWAMSLAPLFWAYPAAHVAADSLWSTLFLSLIGLAMLAIRTLHGSLSLLRARSEARQLHTAETSAMIATVRGE